MSARARIPAAFRHLAVNVEDHGDVVTYDMRQPTPAEIAARAHRMAIETAEHAITYNSRMAAALRNPAIPSPWDILPDASIRREADAKLHDARVARARDDLSRLTTRAA